MSNFKLIDTRLYNQGEIPAQDISINPYLLAGNSNMIYKFNDFVFDENNFIAHKGDTELSIEPLVFDLAIYLLKNKERVVTRTEILDQIWKGRTVSDSTLSNHIKTLRAVLGDDGKKQLCVKTVHGRGYQFIADVTQVSANTPPNDISIKQTNDNTLWRYPWRFSLLVLTFLSMSYLAIHLISQKSKEPEIDQKFDKSIAVLAFRDMSVLKNQNYFAEGISEEILNLLAKIKELKVISRTSSFSYQGKEKDITIIGRELNVRYLIEGSVRKQGDDIRITVQLIDALDGSHVWSEVYDKQMPDIFALQDEIAQVVSDKLEITLLQGEMPKTAHAKPEAYLLYLEASAVFSQHTQEATENAKKLTYQSLEIDANYAPTWNLLSNIHYRETTNLSPAESKLGYQKQRETAEKAIELDPTFASAYASLARIDIHEWKHHSAIKNIDKALELDAGSPNLIAAASDIKFWAGYLDESAILINQAIKSDPLTYINYYNSAIGLYVANKYTEALADIDKYILRQPTSEVARAYRAFILLEQGENEKAHQSSQIERNGYWKFYSQSKTFFSLGNIKASDNALNEFISRYGDSDPSSIADIYAYRKDKENTYKWLDKAIETRDDYLIETIQYPSFSFLYQDKRWQALLNSMGLFESHWLYSAID